MRAGNYTMTLLTKIQRLQRKYYKHISICIGQTQWHDSHLHFFVLVYDDDSSKSEFDFDEGLPSETNDKTFSDLMDAIHTILSKKKRKS